MAALFSLSVEHICIIFSFYISRNVFAQRSARCASTRASPNSHNSGQAAGWPSVQAFRSLTGLDIMFLRGKPLSESQKLRRHPVATNVRTLSKTRE